MGGENWCWRRYCWTWSSSHTPVPRWQTFRVSNSFFLHCCLMIKVVVFFILSSEPKVLTLCLVLLPIVLATLCYQVKVRPWPSLSKQENVFQEEVKSVWLVMRLQSLRNVAMSWVEAGMKHLHCTFIHIYFGVNCIKQGCIKGETVTIVGGVMHIFICYSLCPQTSAYGGCASEKGKPDLQCWWEEGACFL